MQRFYWNLFRFEIFVFASIDLSYISIFSFNRLGLPSFNTVLHNAAASFNRRLGCSTNRLVIYMCNCSFYSVVPA